MLHFPIPASFCKIQLQLNQLDDWTCELVHFSFQVIALLAHLSWCGLASDSFFLWTIILLNHSHFFRCALITLSFSSTSLPPLLIITFKRLNVILSKFIFAVTIIIITIYFAGQVRICKGYLLPPFCCLHLCFHFSLLEWLLGGGGSSGPLGGLGAAPGGPLGAAPGAEILCSQLPTANGRFQPQSTSQLSVFGLSWNLKIVLINGVQPIFGS